MCPVSWSSTKIKRVVRSTLASEAAALSTGYDMNVYVRVLVARLLGLQGDGWAAEARRVPANTWIDCRSLDEMLAKTGATATEKRVTLDIDDVRQFLEDEIEERHASDMLGWTPTATMLADPLTKPIPATTWTALGEYLSTGCWNVEHVGYVECMLCDMLCVGT